MSAAVELYIGSQFTMRGQSVVCTRLTIDLQVPAILHCGEGEMRKLSFTSDDIAIILLLGSYPQGADSHVTVRTRLESEH